MAEYNPDIHVFDPSKCALPLIERIQDLPIIGVCEVPQAPPPIPECPSIELPPLVPLPPCPQLTATAQMSSIQYLEEPSVTVTVTEVPPPESAGSQCPDQACAFNFDFAFQLPVAPCPQITGAASSVEIVADGEEPTVTVAVTEVGEPGQCQYAFDFTFQLPQTICPQLGAQAEMTLIPPGSDNQPSVTVEVTKVDDPETTCKFNFDFAFQIPDPQCPQITATSISEGNCTIDVEVVRLAGCQYQFAFTSQCQAECPQIYADATATSTNPDITLDAAVTVEPTGECGSTLHFDFTIGGPGAQCQCDDKMVAVDSSDDPDYLENQFENTGQLSAAEDLTLSIEKTDTGGDKKLKIFINIGGISGYDADVEQVLTHTAGGGLAWVNTDECPQA